MANDIFAGLYVDVFLSDKTDNTSVQGTDFVLIPELSAFPETGIERTVIDVPNFSSDTNRKLVGRASIPDIALSLNYIPGDLMHEKIRALGDSGTKAQFKIVYYTDATKTIGLASVYNGFISSANLSGGADAVVTQNFTLAIDKRVISQVVDTSMSGGSGNP